jgi:hypothetical protein
MVEQPRVLVDHRRISDEALVEGATSFEVADGESYMSDAGEFGHDVLLERVAVTIALRYLRVSGNAVR